MPQTVDVSRPESPVARRPHASLRHLVDRYHGYHYSVPDPGIHRGLPSSVLTVVLAFDVPLDVGWLDRPTTRGDYWAVASGLHTGPAEIHHEGMQAGIQLGLTAVGARVLLGLPMGALAAEIVPLELVLPRPLRDLHRRLAELSSWQARYDELDRVLADFVAGRAVGEMAAPRPELRCAWRLILSGGGITAVSSVADEVGWSRRHLAHQFRDEFGLTPKQLSRVIRFQRSRALVSGGHALAAVASQCRFADQAHLTREWRAMSGYTPGQWLREEFPFLQDRTDADSAE